MLQDNFTAASRFRGATIAARDDDAIQGFARRFLARHDDLLRRRQAEQRIRDGHGDLRAEHICCADGLAIVDCVEFNPRFRYCDVASDIAFLAMDIEDLGYAECATASRRALRGADAADRGPAPLAAVLQLLPGLRTRQGR